MNNKIKEYYKKIDHSFKSYLHVLNNRSNDSKIINSKNSFNKSFNNNKNIKKNNYNSNKNIYYKNNDNINSFNEIYKKPNVGKIYNKIINTEENINNINTNKINKINKINYIDLDKLCMISNARKEKINCAKMIKNSNVGSKKNVFNKINRIPPFYLKNTKNSSNWLQKQNWYSQN